MKTRTTDTRHLESRLIAAYRRAATDPGSDPALPGADWERRVMRAVQRVGPLPRETVFVQLFGEFVWRFAPATAMAALGMLLWVLRIDLSGELEIAALVLGLPIGEGWFPWIG